MLVTDGSLEVERLMVDKMICSLEDGAISPNEANSLNLMLKSSGLLLEISDRGIYNTPPPPFICLWN